MGLNSFIFRLFLIIAFTVTTVSCKNINHDRNYSKACYLDNCFNIELASTPKARTLGLMYRESLDQNGGMLFIFPNDKHHTFWMKNTLIPLDIIWLSKDEKVVHIAHNTTPKSLKPLIPNEKARYVLEINADICKELGITRNSQLNLIR